MLIASIFNESNYSVSLVHVTPSILYYMNIQQKLHISKANRPKCHNLSLGQKL